MDRTECVDIISDISFRLKKFSVKIPGKLYNFRCPFCGDSKKNPNKARGYFFEVPEKNTLAFKCHNCGLAYSFLGFLKRFDNEYYNDVVLKKYKKDESSLTSQKNDYEKDQPSPLSDTSVKEGILLSELKQLAIPCKILPQYHGARIFCERRKLPDHEYDHVLYVEKFFDFIKKLRPDYDRKFKNDPKVIIPFMDSEYRVHWLQARAILKGSAAKYITFPLSSSFPKIYGLHKRPEKYDNVYVLEGPFDSMFFPNAVAVAGSDLKSAVKYFPNNKLIFVFDNEPNNLEICKKMLNIIKDGLNICIWPKELLQYGKDINDMILSGFSPQEIAHIIETNTYSGFQAEIQFELWKM
ncbi:MAG: hypothetical protein N3A54_01075 [Patescibacteria group bacterium]|nr:hypothetical protein [Patescibacteria group bacterium]